RRQSSAPATPSQSCSVRSTGAGPGRDPRKGDPAMIEQVENVMKIADRPSAVMVKGAGSWLWDQDGKRYLDFVQGWAVNCLGHCPRVVLDALAAQGERLINCSPAYYNGPMGRLAALLAETSGLDQALLCHSGP